LEGPSETTRRQVQPELARQTISVIIPTLNEREEIGNSVHALGVDPEVEIVVVDGGSDDGTVELAGRIAQRVIHAGRGRAEQFNAGARQASGDILVFLHADTTLPPGALDAIRECVARPETAGGAFRIRLDSANIPLRLIAWAINLRSRWLGLPFGDQVYFLRRELFEEMRGFRPLEIMEDVDFVRRLGQRGRIAILPQAVRTSDRRWRANGALRTTLVNWIALFMYAISIHPSRIRRFYDARLRSR